MNIQIATLCDAATDSFGKLNILGAFDTITAAHFPSTYPHCAIALRITFSKIEEGPHVVKLNFMDDDGKLIIPALDMPVQVVVPEGLSFVASNFVLNMQNLKFQQPGQYSVELAMDGRHAASLPLQVRLAAPRGG